MKRILTLITGILLSSPAAILHADEASQSMEIGTKTHSLKLDAANRFAFVPHVGELNKVGHIRFNPVASRFESNTPPSRAGGPGEGPRHMQFHPNGRTQIARSDAHGKNTTLFLPHARWRTICRFRRPGRRPAHRLSSRPCQRSARLTENG